MMNKLLSAVLIVSALALAIVPLFTDCASQGKFLTTTSGATVPMKCHWTGIAEIGVAVPLGLVGIFSLRKGNKETARLLAVVGAAAGVLAILFPVYLIGVCANPMMLCNLVERPALIAAGTLAIAASAILFVNAREPKVLAAQSAA